MIPRLNLVCGESSLMRTRTWKCQAARDEIEMWKKKLHDHDAASAAAQQDGFDHLATRLSTVPD